MKTLLTAATSLEIAPFLQNLQTHGQQIDDSVYTIGIHQIGILITGVGQAHTALMLGRLLRANLCDMALQVGVGGAYNTETTLGELVEIYADRFFDLGAEEQDQSTISVYDLGISNGNQTPYTDNGWLLNTATHFAALPKGIGLTVNTATGSLASLSRMKNSWGATRPDFLPPGQGDPRTTGDWSPQVESMEGAAFMIACLTEGVPFSQIRSYSNYVEPRNRDNWQLGLAVTNLNNFLWNHFSHN
jgi:futalosine hydrolase